MPPLITLARIQDVLHEAPTTGYLVLTDRLWPRGIRKADMEHIEWYKNASPSAKLRKDFHADTLSPQQFKAAYKKQLDTEPQVLIPLIEKVRQKPLYLLTATHDADTSYLTVLREAILEHLTELPKNSNCK